MSELLRKDLQKEIARERVVVVVGAGASIASTNGAPVASWDGLLRHGVDYCVEVAGAPKSWANLRLSQIDSRDTDELISAADLIEKQLGGRERGAFAKWLRDSVGSLQIEDAVLLEGICDLGRPIVTTNYDNLLEQATGLDSVTWKQSGKLDQFVRDRRQAVVHIHGHYERCKTAIHLKSVCEVRIDVNSEEGDLSHYRRLARRCAARAGRGARDCC